MLWTAGVGGQSPKGLALPSDSTFAGFSTCPLDATCKANALCCLMHLPCVNTCRLWLRYPTGSFPSSVTGPWCCFDAPSPSVASVLLLGSRGVSLEVTL